MQSAPPLLSVDDAHARLIAATHALPSEIVPLSAACSRYLALPVIAGLMQPPFDASAMDGYAVRIDDLSNHEGSGLTVIGEAAAGHVLDTPVDRGTCARIFTGAPMPHGADTVVPQEDVSRDGNTIRLTEGARITARQFVRPAGCDFEKNTQLLAPGRRLAPRDLTLAAGAGIGDVCVSKCPTVAILATGDELVAPGTKPATGQIVSSIPTGLTEMVHHAGGVPTILPIARDDPEHLQALVNEGLRHDVLVTLGGASVGDHDLVQQTLLSAGVDLRFWKIAMRPGKPMMFGRSGQSLCLGLPGNPVSALITARIFLCPLLDRLQGGGGEPPVPAQGLAAVAIEGNGPRRHYMRATRVGTEPDGRPLLSPVASQDSSLMSLLSTADALIVREPGAPPSAVGESVTYLPIDF